MKRNKVRLQVHPDYHRLIKMEAAKCGKSIVQYTEEAAKRGITFDNVKRKIEYRI